MTKVLIIEDEPLAAKRLKKLLLEIRPDVEILDVLDSIAESVPWLQENEADLIFLDIHLADGNSFQLLEQVEIDTPIIFATAYDQYAIQAFKHNSIDYLLKPIEQEDLVKSLEKFEKSQIPATKLDWEQLRKALSPQGHSYQQRFIVMVGEKIKSVRIEDIAYFFGQKKYVFLVTKDNRNYIVDYTLGKLEELLNPKDFFRINRQFIIKYDAIQNMYAYSKSRIRIELDPPAELEAIVSIDKSRVFKEWLNQ